MICCFDLLELLLVFVLWVFLFVWLVCLFILVYKWLFVLICGWFWVLLLLDLAVLLVIVGLFGLVAICVVLLTCLLFGLVFSICY